MNWERYIEFKPEILFGKAVIKGTRIPVYLILEKLAAGDSTGSLLKAYPKINLKSIEACLCYASDNARILNYD